MQKQEIFYAKHGMLTTMKMGRNTGLQVYYVIKLKLKLIKIFFSSYIINFIFLK